MRNILLSILLVFGLCGIARADVFGPQASREYKTINPKTGDTIVIEPSTIFDHVTNIVNYLGAREGQVYNLHLHKLATYTAATLYTYKGFALDIGMLDLDGVGMSLDYNVGKMLPTQGIPILQYTQYLYVGGGIGGQYNSKSDSWEIAPFVGGQFKITF